VLTALAMLVTVIGLAMLGPAPLAGLVVIYLGYLVWKNSSIGSEEAFTAVLMLAAACGVLAVFGQFLIERFT